MIHFNSRINILRINEASDGVGGQTETESIVYHNLPCRINWKRGSERIMFDKTTHYRDAKLYCRVIDVTVKDRVKFNDKIYDIVSVSDVDNLGKYLILEIKLVE